MKKFCVLLFIVLKSVAAFAHIEQLFFLQGQLNGKPIAMRLVREDDFYRGEYFFLSEKRMTLFRGNCKEKDCLLNVTKINAGTLKEEVIECFQLKENTDKTWSGTWKKGEITSAVSLNPIDIEKIPHKFKDVPYIKNLDPVSYIRTSDLVLSPVKTKKINGITVEWLKENVTGVQFIRIKKGLPASQLEALNKSLANVHFSNIEGFFWCNPASQNAPYQFNFSINLINKNIVHISTELASNCQGTGTETQSENLTLDTQTGHLLNLEDLFYAGKDAIPAKNSGEWFSYRYNTFGNLIYTKLKDLYPARFTPTEDKCTFNKVESWQFPQWRLSDKGVLLQPYFPDYLHCEQKEEFLIPYKELESYRKKVF